LDSIIVSGAFILDFPITRRGVFKKKF